MQQLALGLAEAITAFVRWDRSHLSESCWATAPGSPTPNRGWTPEDTVESRSEPACNRRAVRRTFDVATVGPISGGIVCAHTCSRWVELADPFRCSKCRRASFSSRRYGSAVPPCLRDHHIPDHIGIDDSRDCSTRKTALTITGTRWCGGGWWDWARQADLVRVGVVSNPRHLIMSSTISARRVDMRHRSWLQCF
jgi:hypothetical protein